MGEMAMGHEVVGSDGAVDVRAVDTDSDAHEHVLGAFGDTVVDAEEVGAFKSFEAEAAVRVMC